MALNNVFDITTIYNGPETFKGIRQVNALSPGFDEDALDDGYLYLVRTSDNKEFGYVYLNGKRYGDYSDGMDCGTY